jgi:hypothetical protein
VCGGDGFIPEKSELHGPPSFQICGCVLHRDILANVERGMSGLSKASVVDSSPLMDRVKQNLWITAKEDWFLPHLRHVAVRNPPLWKFRVISDANLVSAWLATAAMSGAQIFDADALSETSKHATLHDLVIPPDLAVFRMGIKAARNAASSEVMLEAIQLRIHASKPTWIWDTPHHRLMPGHMFYSDDLGAVLRSWEHVLGDNKEASLLTSRQALTKPEVSTPPARVTLSSFGSTK